MHKKFTDLEIDSDHAENLTVPCTWYRRQLIPRIS